MVSFHCFPLFLHFFLLWLNLFFGLSFSRDERQAEDMRSKDHRLLLHFNLGTMWSEVKVAQLCPTLRDPVDYIVHGILQARILGWVAFPFFRGSSQCRDWTQVSHIAGGFFTSWATREALGYNGFIQLSVFLSRNTYHLEIKWLFSFLHRFLHFAMYECIQTLFFLSSL